MPRLRANDRLAPQDAIFLYLENQQMPLHIGSVFIFEGKITPSECLNLVESKLPRIPRYLQRIVAPLWNIGHPTWEYDPDFDIHRHVLHLVLKRGTATELREVAGGVLGQVMDRTRPLWDLTLVEGLQGGRTALIGRVHHCLADGISGSAIMNVILDPSPSPPNRETKKSFRAPSLPDRGTSLLNALLTSWPERVDQILSAQAEALAVGGSVIFDSEQQAFRDLAPFLAELLAPVEPLPFNQPCTGPRTVAWTEIPMADAKAIKTACGTTLNDVVLTVVTAAVQRYAEWHGVALKKRLLRVMVPVSVRHEEASRRLGNQVSMLPIVIPLDIHDPVKLLRAIHRRTEALKGAHVAEFVKLIATWMGIVPAPFQTVLSALTLPVPPFNMVCTNVPGPQVPLYLLGHRMLSSHPYVPIGNGMGVNCAVSSYDGTLYFGLTGDAAAVPDLSRLNKFLHSGFLELRDAAGISAPERPKQTEATPVDQKEAATRLVWREERAEPVPPASAKRSTHAGGEKAAKEATAA